MNDKTFLEIFGYNPDGTKKNNVDTVCNVLILAKLDSIIQDIPTAELYAADGVEYLYYWRR